MMTNETPAQRDGSGRGEAAQAISANRQQGVRKGKSGGDSAGEKSL
jgi:hypothetical protein